MTDDDMVEATKMLIANARKGETAAIRLLVQYVAGKPITGPDPDRVDLDELAIAADSPLAVSAATGAMSQMPPEYLCEILRASSPLMGAAMAAQMKEAMETGRPPQPDTSNMTADQLLDLGPENDKPWFPTEEAARRADDGSKPIERLWPRDFALSRSEDNVEGPVEAREVLEIRVGGRSIRTTAEHPFHVVSLGWLPAGNLRAGGESGGVLSLLDGLDGALASALQIEGSSDGSHTLLYVMAA